jgi:spore maturation protein CgeB
MKLVIFGLTISSSWGNGHATLWRGLCRALIRRGHQVVFFERDVPYYAAHRDLHSLAGMRLCLYSEWDEVRHQAERELHDADAGMVTSYCPDGIAASELLLSSAARLKTYYDLDTPVTLDHWRNGRALTYIPPQGLGDFDLVLSFAGGGALELLRTEMGAQRVAPLYGSVDPEMHRPGNPVKDYRADLSYLGTYAEERQQSLRELFIEPARRMPQQRFLIGGAQYPQEFPWTQNIYFVRHVPPSEHGAFFSSSRLTLNVTRRAMVELGYCPPGRLFEAAACGTPMVSDLWKGLDEFFQPGEEILVSTKPEDTMEALELGPAELARIGRQARERALAEHTADHRVLELEQALEGALDPEPEEASVCGFLADRL